MTPPKIPHFGTSGNPPNFFKSEFRKDRVNAPDWIKSIGLNAYERMMTYGARMKPEDAVELGKKAKEHDIALSVHAAYYIVLTSDKPNVVENSIKEFVKALKLAELMGATKVVFHPGFKNVPNPIERCIEGIKKIKQIYKGPVKILPETMGKISQLGSLDETLEICKQTDCEPCVDFAHLHARNQGSLKSPEDYRKIALKIKKVLGLNALQRLHCHFSPVEFTEKGEKRHRAVTEKNVFPKFEHFAPIIKEFEMAPTLISESRDSQDIGALEMQRILNES